MIYVQKDILDLPHVPFASQVERLYTGIIICPTGQTRLDNEYMEFAVIGLGKDLKPIEIISTVHAARFEFFRYPHHMDGAIKMDMVGFGIMRFWSEKHYMTYNLNSSEDLDIDLKPKK